MILAAPRALLFDWDNTLIDSWGAIHHALNVTLETMAHDPWTMGETRQRVRASARDSFPALFGDRAEEAMEVFYRTFEADHLAQLQARPGAEDMLQHLADTGLYLAVVSNKKGSLLRQEAAHLGWDRYFRRLVGSKDAARDKPAVDAVLLALAGSTLKPGPEVWFVGDTDIDITCAVNAGCQPVLLRPETPKEGEFDGADSLLHIVDCACLTAAVSDC